MQSVMISIQPVWAEKILSGEKTIEVRKTKPRLQVPFKCYIYQTKRNWVYKVLHWLGLHQGKVVAEFNCDKISHYTAEFNNQNCYEDIRLKYFDDDLEEQAEKYITSNEEETPSNCNLCINSCVSFEEVKQYIFNGESGFFDFYGWHISDLVVYDKPKELSEFYTERITTTDYPKLTKMNRPPQSWCYAEGTEVDNAVTMERL